MAPNSYIVNVAVQKDDLMFNSEAIVDIMYVRGRIVPHVEKATHFQASKFLRDDTTESIWNTLLQTWSLIYLGPPDNRRQD